MALARLLSRPERRLLGIEPSGIVEIAASTFQGETNKRICPLVLALHTSIAHHGSGSRAGTQTRGRRDEEEIRV